MLISTPKFSIHNFLDDAKHQCHQKYKVQLCFWSAKQAFPQLTSSILAKQEEPERMKAWCALTLGFLKLYQTDAKKKKSKNKTKIFVSWILKHKQLFPGSWPRQLQRLDHQHPHPDPPSIHSEPLAFRCPQYTPSWLVGPLTEFRLFKKRFSLPESNNVTETLTAYWFWRGKEKLNTLNALETHLFVRGDKERM